MYSDDTFRFKLNSSSLTWNDIESFISCDVTDQKIYGSFYNIKEIGQFSELRTSQNATHKDPGILVLMTQIFIVIKRTAGDDLPHT